MSTNLDWKQTKKFLWFGISADERTGALPAVAVGYGGPTGPRRDLVVTAAHPVLNSFITNPVVVLGTISGLDQSNTWLAPDSPCGNVKDNCYPILKYHTRDDFFQGDLCRNLPAEAVCAPALPPWPGDELEWYSVARREWVKSKVVDYDNLGRLTSVGTLAISQDSGSPVFTPDGKYVGAVSEFVTEFEGKPVEGCLIVTFFNPRIEGVKKFVPDNWKPGDPTTLKPQGPSTTVEIPRTPASLYAVGEHLFVRANPDDSIWRMSPPDDTWVRVAAIPPIVS